MYTVSQKNMPLCLQPLTMAEDRVDFFSTHGVVKMCIHWQWFFTTKVWCWFKSTRQSDWQKFWYRDL